MAGTTTAICTSYKAEILQAAHCWAATVTITATSGNATFTLTSMASTAGIAVGMAVSGTNITSGAVVASVDSHTQITMSKASGGAGGANSTTFTADAFKLALVKSSPSGTYDSTTTNYTNLTGNSDEVSGTGYSAGGVALTLVSPVSTNPTTSAAITFSGTAQWTGATISTIGCIIYNTSGRLGAATDAAITGRSASVHDFGGTQSVTSGTLTLTPPTQDGTTGLIRIN